MISSITEAEVTEHGIFEFRVLRLCHKNDADCIKKYDNIKKGDVHKCKHLPGSIRVSVFAHEPDSSLLEITGFITIIA